MLEIRFTTQGMEHTEALDTHVDEKVRRVEKMLQSIGTPQTAHIEAGKVSGHHKNGEIYFCHIHLHVPGKEFHLSSERDDLYTAVDAASTELKEQVAKWKDQLMG